MPTGLRSNNMSDNNDAGGNTAGGQNNDGGAQNQGGDGKDKTGGSGSQASSGQQQNQDNQGTGSGSNGKTFTQAEVDRLISERLNREKQKHNNDLATARENASKPLQEQLDDLTKKLSDREKADVERNGKLALASVYAALAEVGITKTDVKDVLDTFDPSRLLKDGEPDDVAIEKFAKSLAKVAGRVTPDPDQGQNGSGSSPQTMGDFMRDMARNRR